MSNIRSSRSASSWIEINTTKLTDQSLYHLLVQSDGLALDDQFAVELGMDIPAGSTVNTTSPSTLRIREITDSTDEYSTTTSTATQSRSLITTEDVGHPGMRFLERVSRVTALTVTTETAAAEPIDIMPPTGGSFSSQFEHTAAGAIGAALESIPQHSTRDVYIQLVIRPGTGTAEDRSESFNPEGTETPEDASSKTFAVGISILVGSPSTEEGMSRETRQKEAIRAAKTYFTPPNSTATFTHTWRHSMPPTEFINRPRLRPDATRYRWLSQHLGLAPINSGVHTALNNVGISLHDAHERVPWTRELLGTPGKIRIREPGLRWLFGETPATRPHAQIDD